MPFIPRKPTATHTEARRVAARRSVAAFTILELMIAVVIIGVMSAAVGPGIMQAMFDRKQNMLAQDVVKLIRQAKSEGLAYNRAVLIRMRTASNGTFTAFRGTSNRCGAGPNWESTNITTVACGAANNSCIGQVRFNHNKYYSANAWSHARLRTGPSGEFDICIEPSNIVRWRTTAGVNFTNATPGGGWTFGVCPHTISSGFNHTDTERYIAIYANGTAGIMR